MAERPALETVNATMVAFDTLLGVAAIAAPGPTLRLLGHAPATPDALALFRRCGPIWLTYAAAHLVAARRGRPEDWAGVSWLRATEIATDVLWSRSPGFRASRRGRAGLIAAGAFNLGLAAAAGRRAHLA